MGYIALGILTTILAVIGFVETLKSIVFMMYKRNCENSVMLIIPKFGEYDNLEYFIRSYAENIKWMKNIHLKRIVFITDGMGSEDKKIATLACKDYDFMELMTAEEFNCILKQNIGKKDCL